MPPQLIQLRKKKRNDVCENCVPKCGIMNQAGGTCHSTALFPTPTHSASFQGNGECSGKTKGKRNPGLSTTLPEFES